MSECYSGITFEESSTPGGTVKSSHPKRKQSTLRVGGFFGENRSILFFARVANATRVEQHQKIMSLTYVRGISSGDCSRPIETMTEDREELTDQNRPALDGRYRLQKLLGEGGMGSVYLASDQMLGAEQIALKLLRAELCKDEKETKRFLREVQLTRKITHPNIVRTFDVGASSDRYYLTMEYVEGISLKERLVAGGIDFGEASRIIHDIALGLTAIHAAGIVHRDLKPANVLLTTDGQVKIADFGVARPGQGETTGHQEVIGSAPYMAPEIWLDRDVGPRADLYALGVIAYELISGIRPFEADNSAQAMAQHLQNRVVPPLELVEGLPLWLNALIVQLLEKDQQKRPASAEEVVSAIELGWKACTPAPDANDVPLILDEAAAQIQPGYESHNADAWLGGLETPANSEDGVLNVTQNSAWHRRAPEKTFGELAQTNNSPRLIGEFKRFLAEQVTGRAFMSGCFQLGLGLLVGLAFAWFLIDLAVPFVSTLARKSGAGGLVLQLGFGFATLILCSALACLPVLCCVIICKDLRTGFMVWGRIASALIFTGLMVWAGFMIWLWYTGTLNGRSFDLRMALLTLPATLNKVLEVGALVPLGTAYEVQLVRGMPVLISVVGVSYLGYCLHTLACAFMFFLTLKVLQAEYILKDVLLSRLVLGIGLSFIVFCTALDLALRLLGLSNFTWIVGRNTNYALGIIESAYSPLMFISFCLFWTGLLFIVAVIQPFKSWREKTMPSQIPEQ